MLLVCSECWVLRALFVINAMMTLLSLYLYELLSYVVMPCCTVHTCMLCICGTCIAMCGVRQPSCLFLVASLMGKCLLVLSLSHCSLLPLRNTWDDRHVSFFAPVSVPTRKWHMVFIGVLCSLAMTRFHSLPTDMCIVGSCMHVPVSLYLLGL